MKNKTNMYPLSVKQWCPFVGCGFRCIYCPSSFQAQLKRWAKKNCEKCYDFIPHEHPERLNQSLPKTRYGQFIFTCSNGDIACTDTDYLTRIIARIKSEPDKTFLIQSKNPRTFNRIRFPHNVILGVTLETNRDDLYEGISKAPKPSQRYWDFLEVPQPVKMITVEPVLDFDLDVMISQIESVNPCMIWLGYDSKRNQLPEPPLEKVKALHWELSVRGFTVILKTLRQAWWETSGPADRNDAAMAESGNTAVSEPQQLTKCSETATEETKPSINAVGTTPGTGKHRG